MTVRELRDFLFSITEQDAEITKFKFSECSPELLIGIETSKEAYHVSISGYNSITGRFNPSLIFRKTEVLSRD